MSYEFCGLFEKNGTVYRPYWTDPCGGADITSTMESVDDVYRPVTQDVGNCSPDDTYNKKVSNKYQPVLKFNSYDSLEEIQTFCCGTPEECENCTGDTPYAVYITFSGITVCTNCTSVGATSAKVISSPDFNTTYTATQTENECSWLADAGTLTYRTYATEDCSGEYNEYELDMYAVFTVAVGYIYIGDLAGKYVFYKEITPPVDCEDYGPVNSEIVACDFIYYFGYGGNATVSVP